MENEYWILGLALVLVADLLIGIAVGWLGCSSINRYRGIESETIERLFRRNDELFRVIYSTLRQSREYAGRVGRMREQLHQLPTKYEPGFIIELLDAMDELSGEMATTHGRLERHLDLSQEATVTARRAYRLEAVTPPAVTHDGITADSSASSTQAAIVTRCDPCGPDARSEERQPYLYEQMAAPYINGRIPKRDAFQSVQCCDLSSGGVSFLTSNRPVSDMIVITIGDDRNLVYRTARVVQVAEVPETKEAGRMFRVGCQFTGRLHRHLFA